MGVSLVLTLISKPLGHHRLEATRDGCQELPATVVLGRLGLAELFVEPQGLVAQEPLHQLTPALGGSMQERRGPESGELDRHVTPRSGPIFPIDTKRQGLDVC